MKADGEYGEFFPISFSPYAYNETTAMEIFPLSKAEVLAKGWRWQDNLPGTYGKETIKVADLPDDIKDVNLEISQAILACEDCGKNYKIIPQELSFYKKLNLPLPRRCPYCRHLDRIKRRTPQRLWQRQCGCEKENHQHQGRCENKFETSYSSDRPEKIYCEECYQKEIY